MGQRPLQTKAGIPKLMLIAAGGHIIIVQLAPIVVLLWCVYYLGAELLEWSKTWCPETWMWFGCVTGVILMVALIGFAVDGFMPKRPTNEEIRQEIRETAERERKSDEKYLEGASAKRETEQNLRDATAALEAERRREIVFQQEQALKDAVEKEKQAREQAQLHQKAMRLYVFRLKRANDGAAEAQYDLALQYLTGQGVARDLAAAKDWLQKAAAQGHKKAQKQLELLGATDAPDSPK